jgi:hypothetical protein
MHELWIVDDYDDYDDKDEDDNNNVKVQNIKHGEQHFMYHKLQL